MLAVILTLLANFSQAVLPFPTMPDPRLTAGSLCQNPIEIRYPERIKYCGRDVSPTEKQMIIQLYERKGGYQINKFGRENFKIDHLVPLCMGGSNEANNLWPQHKTIYVYTDPLESLGCQKLSQGRIRQADVIQLLFMAKRNPAISQQVYQRMMAL